MNQENQEYEVFKTVYEALKPLNEDMRSRVVKSVATLLAIDAHVQVPPEDDLADEEEEVAADKVAKAVRTFSTFAELYGTADPTTNGDKALVAGYWLQVCQGSATFTAQAANRELTHLGHRIANITAAFDDLKGAKPALIWQVRKSGSSRQARKTYQVTHEGVKRVEEMIGG